ncbi:protein DETOXIFICATION 45, chloroplastic-like isoform X1 [Mangifera indica]|uniref:protein DETOXIFICATION 45, chloroplastic-like isoform X1 n=2 Tax=Mangifera indica TaxID=29780 RepID=UPI001CFC30C4|nr:protein DETOXIFICATION 45, chloroplastic-like isoform X1 [Mangifera indica]
MQCKAYYDKAVELHIFASRKQVAKHKTNSRIEFQFSSVFHILNKPITWHPRNSTCIFWTMTITQLNGGRLSSGMRTRNRQQNPIAKSIKSRFLLQQGGVRDSSVAFCRNWPLSLEHRSRVPILVTCGRKCSIPAAYDQLNSDLGVDSADVEERFNLEDDTGFNSLSEKYPKLGRIPIGDYLDSKSEVDKSHFVDVKLELTMLTLPAIAGQALDPLAQLMETAYIGRLGSVELASAGVSISIFNIISKLFNFPLLSVATSFVAEEVTSNALKDPTSGGSGNRIPFTEISERKQLASVSTALLLAVGIGIFEALALFLGSGPFLNLIGVPSASEMFAPAQRFLKLRALGAPAVVVSLALNGIFRGFKDSKTPFICLGIGNLLAVFLFPILINYCQMGITGAAISTVVSQYIVAAAMIWYLNKKVVLLPPKIGDLKFGGYIKSGGFLIGRTLAVLLTMTLGTSMAARQGSDAMAAHQICMQVWLAVSLLTDALATSGQALIASYISKGDFETVREVTNFVLKIGVVTGVSLAAILGLSFGSLATLFTKDPKVLGIVRTGILFISATQPITALAFIFDGLHYGVSDFPYAACSMMLVGAISSAFLLYAPQLLGLPGVWSGLALFMALRMTAGFFRLLSRTGPWWFLHTDLEKAKYC